MKKTVLYLFFLIPLLGFGQSTDTVNKSEPATIMDALRVRAKKSQPDTVIAAQPEAVKKTKQDTVITAPAEKVKETKPETIIPSPQEKKQETIMAALPDTTKKTKLEISLSASPDYSFRVLKANDESAAIKANRDSLEIPKLGYTVGIGIGYNLTKKIKLETGIFFSDKGERTKKYSLENVPAGQQAIQYSYNYHYYYLDIPVKVDYYLLTGKLKLFLTAGVSANVFLNQTTTSVESHANSDTKTTSKANEGFNRFNLAMAAGCGLNYPVNKKTILKLEPVYRRSLTSIINTPVKGYLYSFGVNVGLMFNL